MWLFCIFVSIYFISMAFIGSYLSKKIRTFDDYLIAGRSLPLYLVVPTLVATWFGAGSCMGVSGAVYSQGFYAVLADPFGCSLALFIAGLFYAVPFRKLKVSTISDLLANTYGKQFEAFSTLLMTPFYIGTLASQMVAMGYAFEIFLGGSFTIGVLLGSLVVLMYTVTGGMWAVTITDFIQLILLLVALFLILNLCLNQVSDPQATLAIFFKEFTMIGPRDQAPFSTLSYTGRILMTGFGAIMGQDLLQRILSSKSSSVARQGAWLAGIIYFLIGSIPLFIGIAGREILPGLDRAEQLIPFLAKTYLSPLAFTIFTCGLLSAIMSTADSYLLAGSSLITKNIILKLWPFVTDRAKIRLARLINIALTFVALGLAFSGQTIFDMMVHSGAALLVAIFVPASAALFRRAGTPYCGWVSMISGLVAWACFLIYLKAHYSSITYDDQLFAAAAFGGLFSLLGYLVCLSFPSSISMLDQQKQLKE